MGIFSEIEEADEQKLREIELACAMRRTQLLGKVRDRVGLSCELWYQALATTASPHIFPHWTQFKRSNQYKSLCDAVISLDALALMFVAPHHRKVVRHIDMQSCRLLVCRHVVEHACRVFSDANHMTFVANLKSAYAVIDGAFPGYRQSDLLFMVRRAATEL